MSQCAEAIKREGWTPQMQNAMGSEWRSCFRNAVTGSRYCRQHSSAPEVKGDKTQ